MKTKSKKPGHGRSASVGGFVETGGFSMGRSVSKKKELVEVIAAVEALSASGKIAEGVEVYRDWLQDNPSPFRYVALFNMAASLSSIGRREEAEGLYREALQAKPDFCEAHVNLGLTLEGQGKNEEAIAQWRKVTDNPAIAGAARVEMLTTAFNHVGRLLEILHDYEPAEEALRRSLEVNPNQPDAIQHWVHLRQKQCKWPAYQELPGVSKCDMVLATSPLAMLAEADDPARHLLSAYSFVQRKFATPQVKLYDGRKYQHRRLRIGYLSSDFCTHAVGLLLPEIFEAHDRTRVETYGFCVSKEDGSGLRTRLIRSLEHFEKVGHLTDEQIARRILECEIDVLVDLNGLSSGTRVTALAYRPAPVQATWLGFIGPTALPYVDYVIADRFAIPEELGLFYREKPLYLPQSFLPRDTQREVGERPTRAQYQLPEDKFVFASFNNIYKINPVMFETWMRILKRTPNSVLWLLDDNRWATENLKAFAQQHGIGPERLIFAGRVMPKDHLARLAIADVFLDNHPYNAGSTANDVLSMGLPLLTLSGKTFVSRMGGSLLTALGLPECITYSHEEYEEAAVRLGTDLARTRALREKLGVAIQAARGDSAVKFTRGLEEALMRAAGREGGNQVPVIAGPVERRPGEKTLLVRGWRDINHSYSLVNQFQLIEMFKREDLRIWHEDLPYISANWSSSRNGSGFDRETADRIAALPGMPSGEEADAVLSISAPFSLYQGPAKKVVTFMVTEFGITPDTFVPGSPEPRVFTEGRNWVVTPSRWSKRKLEIAGMDPAHIVVVPHGVDASAFTPLTAVEREMTRKQLGIFPGEFAFLNVGGAFWNKGGDLLLRAFAALRREGLKVKLLVKDNRTLYGQTIDSTVQGVERAYPGLLSREVLESIVVLPNSLTMAELRFLYGGADCYVSPYRAEGFNLPVLEAMACGLPVVLTEGGATDDFFLPGTCFGVRGTLTSPAESGVDTKGDYIEPDVEDLARQMKQVRALRGLSGTLTRSAALEAHLQKWTWADATKSLLSVLFGEG